MHSSCIGCHLGSVAQLLDRFFRIERPVPRQELQSTHGKIGRDFDKGLRQREDQKLKNEDQEEHKPVRQSTHGHANSTAAETQKGAALDVRSLVAESFQQISRKLPELFGLLDTHMSRE